jgi:hypothetical protein
MHSYNLLDTIDVNTHSYIYLVKIRIVSLRASPRDFAFVVVCKVPNQNAKSKNRPSPRDFANGLGNYSICGPR